MKDIIILYHAECPDGFSAAWAAWKKFGDEAEYIPVYHSFPPPEGLEGKEVYLLDFTYPENFMLDLIKNNKRVTAIDHHISREKEIKLTEKYSYALENSGSVLAWKYFHDGQPVPTLLKHVEAQDLWNFTIPETKPIVTFIDSYDYTFEGWDKLASDLEDESRRADIIKEGQAMAEYQREVIERIIQDNARPVVFEGYETYAVNAPHEFASEISEILYKKKPPIAITWVEEKDLIRISLRSNGTVDVSKIAQKYGGGGHKEAAGFSIMPPDSFPWKEK